jgi:hypothetical protein
MWSPAGTWSTRLGASAWVTALSWLEAPRLFVPGLSCLAEERPLATGEARTGADCPIISGATTPVGWPHTAHNDGDEDERDQRGPRIGRPAKR